MLEKYLILMAMKGIAFPIAKRKNHLGELLINYYSEEVLDIFDSSNLSWLDYVFSKNRFKRIHPLRHLLLMRSLAGSVKEFFEGEYSYEPFGKGPWICMNPLSDHYLEKRVSRVEISVHNGNREIQGDFICECGFVYRLRSWESSPLEVQHFSNRIIKKGTVWETEFLKLVNSGASMNEISKKTHLSKHTIRKILREGVVDPIQNNIRNIQKISLENREQKTKNYRKIWMKLREEFPLYSRTELAQLDRAAFTWLHKFDKEWLEANSPASNHGKKLKTEAEYYRDDLMLLEMAQTVFNKWSEYEKNLGKLMRKSYWSFCEIIGSTHRLLRKKDYYPMTVDFIKSVEESVVEFQKRKAKHVLVTHFKDSYVTKYQLTEKAGIRKTIKPETEIFVEELIKKHNSLLK
ncbi:TnsD family Tn7-like transposition protein [Aliibacillus thermotolerans]|uniref:TnsD family Tn7-like transposition protein n=1 Tax=Aliibacillus thermotolerans TaxID=1834418 RepID=A0ABW0U544_9BACI|nr:TnsD family Tn7-like transposition protein [Aliibacillus thermotolerans]